jgi:hypothetical protein
MLDKESPRFVMLFCLRIGIDFQVVHPCDFLAHDNKIFPFVLLNQFFLVVFKVFELLLQHGSQPYEKATRLSNMVSTAVILSNIGRYALNGHAGTAADGLFFSAIIGVH